MLTMCELARRAGVSQAAVSFALHGKPGVSEATRQRILELARELGYRADPALEALVERRWRNRTAPTAERIGILRNTRTNPLHHVLFRSAEDRARQLGYGVEMADFSTASEVKFAERWLKARGIRGVIFMEGVMDDTLGPWKPEGMAVINCAVAKRTARYHVVAEDMVMASQQIGEWIIAGDFQRVAFGTFADTGTLRDVLRRAAIGQIREVVGDRCVTDPVWAKMEPDPEGFVEWYQARRPDLLVAANDFFPWTLRQAGLRLPRESQVISLDSTDEWISGFRRNQEEIGRRAIDLLATSLARLEYGQPENQHIVSVASLWNAGSTFTGRRGTRRSSPAGK